MRSRSALIIKHTEVTETEIACIIKLITVMFIRDTMGAFFFKIISLASLPFFDSAETQTGNGGREI